MFFVESTPFCFGGFDCKTKRKPTILGGPLQKDTPKFPQIVVVAGSLIELKRKSGADIMEP